MSGNRPGVMPAFPTPQEWQRLALHALSDLRALGIPIEKIIGMTPAVLHLVEQYEREMSSFS